MSSSTDLVKTWFHRVWANEDSGAISELFVPDGTTHGLSNEPLIGPEEFAKFHAAICAVLSGITISIDNCIESGPLWAGVCTVRATSKKTGEKVKFSGQVFVRIEDGKIREAHNQFDFISFWQQLNLLPPNAFERGLSGEPIV